MNRLKQLGSVFAPVTQILLFGGYNSNNIADVTYWIDKLYYALGLHNGLWLFYS